MPVAAGGMEGRRDETTALIDRPKVKVSIIKGLTYLPTYAAPLPNPPLPTTLLTHAHPRPNSIKSTHTADPTDLRPL